MLNAPGRRVISRISEAPLSIGEYVYRIPRLRRLYGECRDTFLSQGFFIAAKCPTAAAPGARKPSDEVKA